MLLATGDAIVLGGSYTYKLPPPASDGYIGYELMNRLDLMTLTGVMLVLRLLYGPIHQCRTRLLHL